MSRPRKATLIEAAEYLKKRARSERQHAKDLRLFERKRQADNCKNRAHRFSRWAKHIRAAAEQE